MRRIIVALILAICIPTFAFAWGPKGHKAVAEISLSFLSDKARREVEALLGTDHQKYIDAAIFADQIRNGRPETAPWHFVDIPRTSGVFTPSRDCKNGDCIIPKITEFAQRAANKKINKASRVEALKFVIHFVGDIHQPLHCADDNDRGGNDVFVRIGGKTDKLHAWWDTGLVNPLGSTPSDVAESVMSDISNDDVRNWSKGTPQDWAMESFKIAHDFIYEKSRGPNTKATPIILPPSYIDEATPMVSERLQRAGVRLAFILNRAFK
jgi:hypothetical protein